MDHIGIDTGPATTGNRDLRHLLLGEGLGLLAGSAAQTGLAWWIAQAGGGADLARYGSLMALGSLAALALMAPMGDRWPKPRLIRMARALLLVDALLLTLLAWRGLYQWSLIAACGVLSLFANALLLPAQASLLAELVSPRALPRAIRLRRGAQALGGLLGPALAGAALAFTGLAQAMALNALLFGLSALAACALGAPPYPSARAPAAPWLADVGAGLRAKWQARLDRWWTLTGALMMVFLAPAIGLLLPLRLQSLQLGALWFGACTAALPLGVLAGVAGLADALMRRVGRPAAIAAAVVLCGAAMAVIGLARWPVLLVLSLALIGLGMSITQLVGQTHRTLAVPEPFRARMAAAQLGIAQLAAALAPALAGLLLQAWPVATVYLGLAGGFLLSGLLLLAIPELRTFLNLEHEAARDWYGRRYPQAFARPDQPGCGSS